MSELTAAASHRATAIRIFGTTGALLAVLLVTLLVTRPDMLMTAMHAVMGVMR